MPLDVLSKGGAYGRALFLIDYGENHSLIWVVGLENGEIWAVKNEEVRLPANWTMHYEANR